MTIADLEQLPDKARASIEAVRDLSTLTNIEVKYLGRKSQLALYLRTIKDLPNAERVRVGKLANEVRASIAGFIEVRRQELGHQAPVINTTLPGIVPVVGHAHIVNEAIAEITNIFKEVGFTRTRHPEIESEWYPFEALNMPADHPARNESETFFMKSPKEHERYVLTTQATSGTARSLATKLVPLRVINIQKTYRRELDISHVPMFHQFDGVWVDEHVTLQHLKGVFEYFVKAFFGPGRAIRFRPHHFQFTEPSFEIDISCSMCAGKGCRVCKEGWLELGGSGMLHPNVLKTAGIDSKKLSGFAFGWGVERVCFMRQGLEIPDIRILYDNDLRFLHQY